MNDIMDMKISGSSAMPGGEYRLVSISGSGKVQGSLRCESLRCSGSARVQGDVDCAGEIRCSGSSRVTGDITCQELGCSGSTRCEGSLRANGRVHSSGALKVDGSLEGGEVDVSGGLEAGEIHCGRLHCSGGARVSGGVEAESVHLTGSAVIQGLLNAETVEISASRGIRIGSIGGSSIRIYKTTWTWNTPRPTWSGAAGSASARAAPSDGWSTARAWTPGTEPWAKASAPVKAPSDMELLYTDKRIAVAVKPPGVLSTDEPGGMPELLRAQLGTPCIRTVHRLDAATGGVMVFARSAAAASILSGQVREHRFRKIYLAVVRGDPGQGGIWRDMLGRDPVRRVTYIAREPGKDVRPAELSYEALAVQEGLSLVRVTLHTGRTHQIRVQFAGRGFPLVGDRKYGGAGDGETLALWAWRLGFTHPETGRDMVFTHQPPAVWPWTLFPLPETGK